MDGAGFDLSTLFTSFGSSNAITPLLRYQMPSFVCHASSASIVLPLCKVITTGPLLSLAAVEIALELNSMRGCVGCGVGEVSALGDGDGSAEGLGLESGGGGATIL